MRLGNKEKVICGFLIKDLKSGKNKCKHNLFGYENTSKMEKAENSCDILKVCSECCKKHNIINY